MESILKAIKKKKIPIKPTVVISNKPDAKGLQIAEKMGIQTEVIDSSKFKGKRQQFDKEVIAKIKKNPREFIAQPLEILSTAPTITKNDIEPRHLDLRPFVLSGKSTYVTTGGLTRVALRKGSTIVNSSQGGGSKDTLIVDI